MQRATEDGVKGYRVSANSSPYHHSEIVTGTAFTFDPSLCDGNAYTYSVEAVNECNQGSPLVYVKLVCGKDPQFNFK